MLCVRGFSSLGVKERKGSAHVALKQRRQLNFWTELWHLHLNTLGVYFSRLVPLVWGSKGYSTKRSSKERRNVVFLQGLRKTISGKNLTHGQRPRSDPCRPTGDLFNSFEAFYEGNIMPFLLRPLHILWSWPCSACLLINTSNYHSQSSRGWTTSFCQNRTEPWPWLLAWNPWFRCKWVITPNKWAIILTKEDDTPGRESLLPASKSLVSVCES